MTRWPEFMRLRPEMARMRAAKGDVGASSLASRVLLESVKAHFGQPEGKESE